MKKYASILGIDKMSTSVIRFNDTKSRFLPGLTLVLHGTQGCGQR